LNRHSFDPNLKRADWFIRIAALRPWPLNQKEKHLVKL